MSFDRSKIIAEGGKYHGSDNPLIESAPFVVTSSSMVALAESGNAPAYLKEDASLPKRMVIEGVFQRADVLNANRRVYPRSLWERLLDPNGSVMQRINERAMIGHLEHPESGSTDLNKGAILITKVWMEADGTVKGRAIIYNTPEGLRLQEYIATGTKVGISSRGTGTVDARGVVCEDFALETWDMVYNPSTPGANPTASETTESLTDGKPTRVIENQLDPVRIDPRQSQDKPMSLSKRIAECRANVEPLLAQDPKRLTESGRTALAGKLLDARAQVAKDFTGEDRVTEVEAIIKQLAEAKAACEAAPAGAVAADVAPEGQVPTGVPGGAMDSLSKAIDGLAGDAKTKAVESMKSLSDLIAANLGKIPQIVTAVGEAITEKNPKIEELVALLREARDEIKTVTKREEAALAMVAESAKRIKALQASVQEAKVREDAATKTIADLTAGGGKKAEDKGVTESAANAVPKKTLQERIAEAAKATSKAEDPALPTPGAKVESAKDAAATPKKVIHEGANNSAEGDLSFLGRACKKIDESAPRAR